ncbi:hypothetical protein SMIR_36650 [Streptomyces mirabilis]|uniref:hypothetical protein n=1 Tax=Streptomyces mirabilis TaxID=68239 RepID=UPI001BB05241|nr:hypothetical protein [Streptomyces mirabilis]QUW84000.1 hypothetical protein SMIR_36650 [Streptomyces mirabilis]
MSQCNLPTSMPNSATARAPTVPAIRSSSGAIASSARARRSSFSRPDSTPSTSSIAEVRAQSPLRTSGAGEVSRFATIGDSGGAAAARP